MDRLVQGLLSTACAWQRAVLSCSYFLDNSKKEHHIARMTLQQRRVKTGFHPSKFSFLTAALHQSAVASAIPYIRHRNF